MARPKTLNNKKKSEKELIKRFQELVQLLYNHYGVNKPYDLYKILVEAGHNVKQQKFCGQLDPTSVPSEVYIRKLTKLAKEQGYHVNIQYVFHGDKKRGTLLYSDNEPIPEDQEEEIAIDLETSESIKFNNDDDDDNFPEFNFNEGDAVNLEADDTPNLEEDSPKLVDEEVPLPPVEEDTLTESTDTDTSTPDTSATVPSTSVDAPTGDPIPTQADQSSIPAPSPVVPTPSSDSSLADTTIPSTSTDAPSDDTPSLSVNSVAETFTAKTAYEKWCDDARSLGIQDIDDKGMSITKDGITYAFVPADKKKGKGYRQIILDFANNDSKPKKTINYKNDRVRWTVTTRVILVTDKLEIEAPTREEAELKANALSISAYISDKPLKVESRQSTASNPRSI